MKRTLLLTALLLTALFATAQQPHRRGFALGVDRDTLLYLIASPFDNWYITPAASLQTFIGNEVTSSARLNKLNYGGRVEVGKWIIPDVAVSLRFGMFNVDGQSIYGRQPFINKLTDDTNANGYYPYHAHAATLMGFVTLDWTNFLNGYEVGKRTHLHVFTPVGLGASMLYGKVRNPRCEELGSVARNFELAFAAGIGMEYELSQEVALNATAELFGSESTWDWSPYNNSKTIFDFIPSVSVGMRINFLRHVRKYNPYTYESKRVKTFHEFQTVGSRGDIERREVEVRRLNGMQDSLVRLLVDNNGRHDELMRKYDSLANDIDSINRELAQMRQPSNVIEELLGFNETQGLPAVIVYFQLDRYEIDYNGSKKLQNFAREMNRLSDTLQFYLIGAADSATGTVSHNQWLSERRCQAVFDMLTKQYGVDAKRIDVRPVGGITEYEPQENNRMGMLILRTPETEEIVNRWLRKQ